MRAGGLGAPALVTVLALLTGCLAPAAVETAGLPAVGEGAAPWTANVVTPGAYDLSGDWARVLVPGELGILEPEIVDLKSDVDGARMPLAVILPDAPEGTKVPVIAFATPYLFQGMTPERVKEEFEYEWRVENFVPHGYAVAFVPVRGTSDHGGCMDLMGPKERADLDQAITWLGEQPWSNGRVGIVGLSYDGSTPWEVAATGNPYLKTIVPISGVTDIFSLMFNNGTTETRGPVLLPALYYSFGFAFYNPVQNGRAPQHVVNGVVCPESWEAMTLSVHSATVGERDPLGFWAERDSRPGVEANYEGSILLVQGLQDWNVDPHIVYPWIHTLEAKGLAVKHLLGQWDHAFPDRTFGGDADDIPEHPRMDWAEMLLRWFDHWLKEDATSDLGPRVEVQDSAGQWRWEDDWPPKDAVATPFHLSADGTLAREAASAKDGEFLLAGTAGHVYTEPVTSCRSCAYFETEPFVEEFRFAGIPTVHLTVVPTGPGAVGARLYAVDGDAWTRLGWGMIDLAFAAGGETRKEVVPGQPLEVKMVLEPLDAVVPPGSKLVLHVNQAAYGDRTFDPATPLALEVGGEASVLTVHAFARDGATFFEPPTAG